MDTETIGKLAELARLSMNTEEKETLAKELESVLSYVDQLRSVDVESVAKDVAFSETLREDVSYEQSEETVQSLIDAAPQKEGRYIKVQNIL